MKTKGIHNIDALTAVQREYLALLAKGVSKSKAIRLAQRRTRQTLRTKGLDEDALLNAWKDQCRPVCVTGVPVTRLARIRIPDLGAHNGTISCNGDRASAWRLHDIR